MSKESVITMVFPANVAKVWPLAAPLLEDALAQVGTHTVEDVRRSIMAGAAQLWVQWQDGCDAALVSEFKAHPQGLWLNVWLIGAAPERKTDIIGLQDHMIDFARANHCAGITVTGRMGWSRHFAHFGSALKKNFHFILPFQKEGQ